MDTNNTSENENKQEIMDMQNAPVEPTENVVDRDNTKPDNAMPPEAGQEKESMPGNLKYIYVAMAALVILLAIGAFIVRGGHHNAKIEASELASAPTSETKKIQKSQPVMTDKDKKIIDSVPAILSRQKVLDEKIQTLNDSISVIKSRLDDMNKSIEANKLLADRAAHLQTNLGGIYTRLDATDKKLNHLNQDLLKAKKIKTARAKRAYKRRLKMAHLKPPFTLVNTQLWSGAMIAVIKNAQSQWSVKKDNIVNGWIIQSISSRCITTRSMHYHKIVHLCQ